MTEEFSAAPQFAGRRVIVFDTEGTQIEQPEILEHALLELEPSGIDAFFLLEGLERQEFPMQEGRHETEFPSHLGALATHGILPDDVKGLPRFNIEDCLGGTNLVLIGHQVDYDWRAVSRYASSAEEAIGVGEIPRICTLAMARRLWPDLDSHRLGALMYHIRGVNEETREVVHGAHGALVDVMMCMQVLIAILKEKPDIKSWRALWEFSEDARLPRKWSFGKFEGQPLGAADRGYISWVRKNCTDREDWEYLAKALDKMERGELTP